MPITTLPTPPSRSDPANFSVRADAFFAALPAFVAEFNAMVPAAFAASVTGSFSVTGNISLGSGSSNTLTIRAGSAALPALIPSGDTNTGLWFPAGDTVAVSTSGVERARWDSAGALLVGTTSITPGDDTTAWVGLSGGAITQHVSNAASAGTTLQGFYRGASAIGSITQSGTTAVLYNTTSDARLKCNVADAPDAGAIIDALRVRSFDWREAGNEHVTHGFIAQELAAVAPLAVKVGDGGDEVIDPWAIDPSKLVALLVREIQSLRARVAALGG